MTMSTFPASSSSSVFFCSFSVRNRLSISMRTGNAANRRAERFVVLKRQHGGRRQHGHLLGIRDGLERRAHGHFRLAVADVAAEQPVHRQRAIPCRALRPRWLSVDRAFPRIRRHPRIRAASSNRAETRDPAADLALRIQRQKLFGHVVDGLAHARLARFPDSRAQAVERRLRRRRATDISESGRAARAAHRAAHRPHTAAA